MPITRSSKPKIIGALSALNGVGDLEHLVEQQQNVGAADGAADATAAADNAMNLLGKKLAMRVYCPRAQCAALILREGAATLVRKAELGDLPLPAAPELLPPGAYIAPTDSTAAAAAAAEAAEAAAGNGDAASSANAHPHRAWYWQVATPMDFDNVGFSRAVGGVKYLSCADCDLGPLGVHPLAAAPPPGAPGGALPTAQIAYIKADRVRYGPRPGQNLSQQPAAHQQARPATATAAPAASAQEPSAAPAAAATAQATPAHPPEAAAGSSTSEATPMEL